MEAPAGPEVPLDPPSQGQNLGHAVSLRLRADIVAGRLPPDGKLSIDELRRRFGISLSPLREALARLSAEGFVVNEDKKGFRVAPVSLANLEEVTAMQVSLEPMAVRESVQLGDARWEESLILAHQRMHRLDRPAAKQGRNVEHWEALHRAFHMALIGACARPLLLATCDTLQQLSDRYRRLFLGPQRFSREIEVENQAMVDAALDRDADTVAALLAEHIAHTARGVRAVLQKRERGTGRVRAG